MSYTPSEKNGFFSQIVWHSQFFVVVLQILGEYPGMGDCIIIILRNTFHK